MKTQTNKQKGIVALILLSLVFASMGLFVRYLSTGLELFQQVYMRVLAAFFIGIFLFHRDIHFEKLKKISSKEWITLVFRAAASYLFGVTLFSKAVILTKYSNVSFIGALPLVALLGFILLKEKITFSKILLILTAFIGGILISVEDYAHIFSWGTGEILALVSTAGFAFSYIARKWHSDLLNNKEISVLIFSIAFILVFLTSLFFGETLQLDQLSLGILLTVLVAGLFNVANMSLVNYGFQNVEAVLASNILTLESLFAVVFGFLFYQEIPTIKELIGGIIILVSVFGMNKLESKSSS